MPCSDWPHDEISGLKDSHKKELDAMDRKRHKAEKLCHRLEACLCAIFNELISRNIADEIIPAASKNGKVDLMEFWIPHVKQDVDRLQKELDKFSEHERMMLKKLLSKEN